MKKSAINEVGEKKFFFNEKKELEIYKCLCLKKVKRRCNIEYHTYSSWKQYICGKYSEYTKEQLIEFSRFLNQKIRNEEPGHEYWNIMIPVLMTVMVDGLFKIIFDMEKLCQSSVLMIIIKAVVNIGTFVGSVWLINKITEPLFNTYDKENFFKDYKEIIDGIISNK